MTDVTELDLYGKDLTHSRLQTGYETHDDYAGQGDTRVVKHLQFPVHVKVANPMLPGQEIIQERVYNRNDRVSVEELGLIALEKGERLGSFYTDAELAAGVPGLALEPVKVNSEEVVAAQGASVSEMGSHELVVWLSGEGGQKTPSVPEVLEVVGEDKELAKRVVEAERTRDANDPRKTLIDPLTRLAETE